MRRFLLPAALALLLLPQGAAAADDPPAPYVPKLSPRPGQKKAPSTPMDEAAAEMARIRKCEQKGDWFEAKCAVSHLHGADKILRRHGVTYDDAPQLWWAIFQGLGRSFASIGDFPKAKEFFGLAGFVRGIPAAAYEETAYNMAGVLYALGESKDALERLDSLFQANSDWLVRAEADPAFDKFRQTPEWEKMAEPHYQRRKDLGLPEHGLSPKKSVLDTGK